MNEKNEQITLLKEFETEDYTIFGFKGRHFAPGVLLNKYGGVQVGAKSIPLSSQLVEEELFELEATTLILKDEKFCFHPRKKQDRTILVLVDPVAFSGLSSLYVEKSAVKSFHQYTRGAISQNSGKVKIESEVPGTEGADARKVSLIQLKAGERIVVDYVNPIEEAQIRYTILFDGESVTLFEKVIQEYS